MVPEKSLIIDNSYISDLFDRYQNNKFSKLDDDLDSMSGGDGKVYLNRPSDKKLDFLFHEIRSHVAAKSILGSYTIFPQSQIDYEIIKQIIGSNNAVGDFETGITFKRAA